MGGWIFLCGNTSGPSCTATLSDRDSQTESVDIKVEVQDSNQQSGVGQMMVTVYDFGYLRAAGKPLPEEFALQGNAPNPFSGRTTIRFALPEDAHVELVVYDVMGREVVRLVDRELPAGYHHATLEAGDLSSGVYIYRMTAGDKFTDTRRMVVVK